MTCLFSPQYLHKLFKRDHHKGQKYHEKQIVLYAEYDRPNLLPFLRDSTHCPLEKVHFSHVIVLHIRVSRRYETWTMSSPLFCQALEVCQQRNFVEETVFLLSRCYVKVCLPAWRALWTIQRKLIQHVGSQVGWGTADELCRWSWRSWRTWTRPLSLPKSRTMPSSGRISSLILLINHVGYSLSLTPSFYLFFVIFLLS